MKSRSRLREMLRHRRLAVETLEARRVLAPVVYVNDDWSSLGGGTAITDADPGAAGNQPATIGVNAFATINAGLGSTDANGATVVQHGTYAETVTLNGGKTLRLTGQNATTASTVTITSLSSDPGTIINLQGNALRAGNSDGTIEVFAGTIQGSGGSLTKLGTDQWTISAANTYTGGTTISSGRVRIENAGAFGTGAVNVAAGSYVMLWFNTGSMTVPNDFILNGIGGNFSGEQKDAIYADGGGAGYFNYTLSGNITLNATSNIGGHTINHVTITGQITGAGGLTKGGTRTDENNTLTLTNPANDYAGPTTVVLGELEVGAAEVIPHGPGKGDVTVNAGTRLDVGAFDETINGLSGSGSIVRQGALGLQLFTTNVGSGISASKNYLHLLDFVADGSAATVNGVNFTAAGTTGGNWSLNAPNAFPEASGAASSPAFSDGGPGTGMNQLFRDFQYNANPANLTLFGFTAGTTYELRLYNRFWGGPRQQSITFDHDGSGPASTTITFDEDFTTTPNYLSYRFTAESDGAGGARPLTVSFGVTSGGTYHFYGLSTEVVTEAVPTLTVGDASDTTFTGTITGQGNFVKDGSGTLTVGSGLFYTGNTTVEAGTLRTTSDEAIPDGPNAGGLTVNGTLDLSDFRETVNSLSGSGNILRTPSTETRISRQTFNTDAGSGISTAKTYTHALDFIADGGAAVVNGVPFIAADRTGTGWSLNTPCCFQIAESSGGTLPTQLDDAGMERLYRDFYYNAPNAQLTLSNLVAGTTYEVRLYDRHWGGPRILTATFDEDGAGPLGESLTFDQDATTTPSFLAYRYTAASNGSGGALPLVITMAAAVSATTYHWYGVTNEVAVVTPPALIVGDSTSTTFSGAISGSAPLTKQGSGTLTLSGNNTYSGATNVTGGTLLVDGSTAAASAVTVASGATLGGDGSIGGAVTVDSGATLAGSLTISGATSVASGALVAPGGVGGTGILTAAGGITLAAGATVNIDIAGATPGAGHDQLAVTGPVNLTGVNLTTNVSGTVTPGAAIVLVANDGSDTITGGFTGVAQNDPLTLGGQLFAATYRQPGTTGNDFALVRNDDVTAVTDILGPVLRNTSFDGNVLENDLDADGDAVITAFTQPASGQVTLDLETGDFTYTPDEDFVGADQFTYTLSDGEFTSIGTVNLSVETLFVSDDGTLFYSAGGSSDRIIVSLSGGVQLRVNNRILGKFPAGNRIVINGGGGNDTITVASNVFVPVEFFGGDGNDYLTGGRLADLLDGGPGNDRLIGGAGEDLLIGGEGNDSLRGGLNNDTLQGDDGNDIINGEGGHDILSGDLGNDRMNGGTGNDTLQGGEGLDTLDGAAGDDVLSGGFGSDRMYGRAGSDLLVGGADFDTLYGGTGDDLVTGSETAFDEDNDMLLAVLLEWTGGGSLLDRIDGLTADLLSDGNLSSAANNTLYGEGGSDWFVTFFGDGVRDKRSGDVLRRIE